MRSTVLKPASIIAYISGVATMPLLLDNEEDHFYIVTVLSGIMWFVGHAGMISVEDFAYACQVMLKEPL